MTAPFALDDDVLRQAQSIVDLVRGRGRRQVDQARGAPDSIDQAALAAAQATRGVKIPKAPLPVDWSLPHRIANKVGGFLGQAGEFLGRHGEDIAAGLSGLDPQTPGIQGQLGSGAEAYNQIMAVRRGRQAAEESRAARGRAEGRAERQVGVQERTANATEGRGEADMVRAIADMIRASREPRVPPHNIDPNSSEGIAAQLRLIDARARVEQRARDRTDHPGVVTPQDRFRERTRLMAPHWGADPMTGGLKMMPGVSAAEADRIVREGENGPTPYSPQPQVAPPAHGRAGGGGPSASPVPTSASPAPAAAAPDADALGALADAVIQEHPDWTDDEVSAEVRQRAGIR